MSDPPLVDVQLPDEPAPGEQPVVGLLGPEHENVPRFGRAGEPARAGFPGDRAGFVVPVVEEGRVAHVHALVTERHLTTAHRGPTDPLETLNGCPASGHGIGLIESEPTAPHSPCDLLGPGRSAVRPGRVRAGAGWPA